MDAKRKKDLWTRLQAYSFQNLIPPNMWDRAKGLFGDTNPSTRAFANKLSRKFDWPISLALQAIEEYKRFVYLGMVSDSSVTPSRIIDQVWHEHQLFTQAYREFCHTVLNQNFDHFPELIPDEKQTSLFHDQFQATLAMYKKEFGVHAPHDVWALTKFKPDTPRIPVRQTASNASLTSSASGVNDVPLFLLVSGMHDSSHHHASHDQPTGNSPSHDSSPSHDHTPASDGGSVGSSPDTGSISSCGGGTSCSSSCGGGT